MRALKTLLIVLVLPKTVDTNSATHSPVMPPQVADGAHDLQVLRIHWVNNCGRPTSGHTVHKLSKLRLTAD
jgi:hypothetical protein